MHSVASGPPTDPCDSGTQSSVSPAPEACPDLQAVADDRQSARMVQVRQPGDRDGAADSQTGRLSASTSAIVLRPQG
jgi:hypothetical protein